MRNFLILVFVFFANLIVAQQVVSPNSPSGTIICNPSLVINKFKIPKKDSGSATDKKWKVVIGRNIEYLATPKDGGVWKWELGSGNYWGLLSVGGDFKSESKAPLFAMIPNSKMPSSNSDFGSSISQVTVTSNSGISSTTNPPGQIVEIFFEKDVSTAPGSTDPNWFYYWKDAWGSVTSAGIPFFSVDQNGIVSQGTTPNLVSFILKFRNDGDYKWVVPAPGTSVNIIFGSTDAGMDWSKFVSSSGNYGPGVAKMTTVPNSSNVCLPLGARRVMTGYEDIDFTINIGEGCGYKYNSYIYDINTGLTNGSTTFQGIEAFVTVLTHEMEHWKLKEWFWNGSYNPSILGYDTALDCDLDLFPDDWEINDPVANLCGFKAGNWDRYTNIYDAANLNLSGNPATWYEEMKCRNSEGSNSNLLNNKDWSFDPKNDYQGKNWK